MNNKQKIEKTAKKFDSVINMWKNPDNEMDGLHILETLKTEILELLSPKDINSLREELFARFKKECHKEVFGHEFAKIFDWFKNNIYKTSEDLVSEAFAIANNEYKISKFEGSFEEFIEFKERLQSKVNTGLPTDEEIIKEANKNTTNPFTNTFPNSFIKGAKWMRDKYFQPKETTESVEFLKWRDEYFIFSDGNYLSKVCYGRDVRFESPQELYLEFLKTKQP